MTEIEIPLPPPRGTPRPPAEPERPRGMTIGAVVKQLKPDFPDISISKVRYLEDQKLLNPKRTPGGYRLYAPQDVARLRTVLRLQRDEFLPLRVIRQELARGRAEERAPEVPDVPASRRPTRRAAVSVGGGGGGRHTLEDLLEDGAEPGMVEELRDYGVVSGRSEQGRLVFDDTEREIVRAVAELARFGVKARNLRVFRTSADREAALLQQILTPALRSRNPERRREGLDALEDLAAVTAHLKHLLLIRGLRELVGGAP